MNKAKHQRNALGKVLQAKYFFGRICVFTTVFKNETYQIVGWRLQQQEYKQNTSNRIRPEHYVEKKRIS